MVENTPPSNDLMNEKRFMNVRKKIQQTTKKPKTMEKESNKDDVKKLDI
jgi:hypothetical protein